MQYTQKIDIQTTKQFELVDITSQVRAVVAASGIKQGIVLVFSTHTTAGIRINHNEPLLIQDIMQSMYRMVPQDHSYNHDLFELRDSVEPTERSNGHAHVKAFIMGSSETIPLEERALLLSPKQSIFFVEFDGGRKRDCLVTVVGA